MYIIKTCVIAAFILTLGALGYLLYPYFTNPYFLIGFAVFIILLILLNFYMNGGKNHYYPDLAGKIIIITGANAGLGYESAKNMA